MAKCQLLEQGLARGRITFQCQGIPTHQVDFRVHIHKQAETYSTPIHERASSMGSTNAGQ